MLACLTAIDESIQISREIAEQATLKLALLDLAGCYQVSAEHLFDEHPLCVVTDGFDLFLGEEALHVYKALLLEKLSQDVLHSIPARPAVIARAKFLRTQIQTHQTCCHCKT